MVEVAQPVEAELADSLGGELAAAACDRELDPVDESLDLVGCDLALVGRAQQRRPQLRPVEALALAVALSHMKRLGRAPLEGGEAVAAGRALATAPQGGTVLGFAALKHPGRLVASRTFHPLGFYSA